MRKTGISMKDIAEELGISRNAVSLALGNKPGVSPKLREQVFEAAARFGYSVEEARRSEKSRNLLILTPDLIADDRMFYTDIYMGIQRQAQVTGHFTMLMSVSKEMIQMRHLPSAFDTYTFDGVLSVGVIPGDYLQLIQARGIPLVAVDNYYDDLALNSVVSTNSEGAYQLTLHLIQLGHRDIGFVGPVTAAASFYERWDGFRKAMSLSNLEVRDEFNMIGRVSDLEIGKNAAEMGSLLSKMQKLPTAFVSANDEIAITLIKELKKKGIEVPREISVVGFDDIEASRHFSPELTTYRVPRIQMGQEAVRFLFAVMADKKRDHLPAKRSLYGSLEIRESTSPVLPAP